jgi:hypothetical protein
MGVTRMNVGDEFKKGFWRRTTGDWGGAGLSDESVYVTTGRPLTWRREDPSFEAACDQNEADADRKVVDTVRSGALDGNPRAQVFCFRAARGPARAVDMNPPATHDHDPLPPEVAAAMIEAGLAALNTSPGDLGEPPAV